MLNNLHVIELSKMKKAVGFLKSRKSHDKIHHYCYETYCYGIANGLCIHEFIVDESAGVDIDREYIDKLMHLLEKGDYECVVVPNVIDFTKDADDLLQFLLHLKDVGCLVYSLEENRFLSLPQITDHKKR